MKEIDPLPPLLAIDIGSSSVKAMVARRVDNNTLFVLGYEESKRDVEVHQGVVTKPYYIGMTVREIIEKLVLKLQLKDNFKSVFVCLGGKTMKVENVPAQREFTKPKIIEQSVLDEMEKEVVDKVEKNIKNTTAVAVLGVYPAKYILDDHEQTYPPTERQVCQRIYTIYNAFVGMRDLKYKVKDSLMQANLEIKNYFARPDALCTVLTDDDKEDGFAIVDMGAQTTTLTVFKDGEFVYSKTFLYGGDNITKAIMKYEIPFSTAEALKMQYASCRMKKKVSYQVPTQNMPVLISSDELTAITREKIDELFDTMFKEASQPLEDVKKIYLTGGGALLNGLIEYVARKTRVAILRGTHARWLDAARSQDKYCMPKYAALIGTLVMAFDYQEEHKTMKPKGIKGKMGKMRDMIGVLFEFEQT